MSNPICLHNEYMNLLKTTKPKKFLSGVKLIADERRRQVSVEGWDAGHDDEHDDGQLAKAAACYAMDDTKYWPWSFDWWKPTEGNRVRDLVKAGALIAAEIDRLNRE